MDTRATIDLETRSTCNIKKSGAWRYSVDPMTEVLCLCYRLPYWEEGRVEVWTPAVHYFYDHPGFDELVAWIESDGLVEAHNAFFERCIWQNILVARYGFPRILPTSWRCSAAKAAACALPRSLKEAGAALKLSIAKDDSGHKLMLKMSKPRKVLKREITAGVPATAILYHETAEQLAGLIAYCKQDVLAEEALSQALPDLSADEQQVYWLDQQMNERGFQLDQEAVEVALKLLAREAKSLNGELADITEGVVQKASQRIQLLAWLQGQGVDIEDTTKETVSEALSRSDGRPDASLSPARRALEILQSLGQSSTAKYESMRLHVDSLDWRIRGGLLYHGATTGRWSGSGVQPHNFPKGTIKDIDGHWVAIKLGVQSHLEGLGASRMSALSQGLRGAIVATPGKSLYVADYNAIEARVLAWLADDTELLEDFKNGIDPYLKMASAIYGYPCNKQDHGSERALGKVAILGLGYQMGAAKFRDSAYTMGKVRIDEDLAQKTVDIYRERRWRIKRFWWDMQDAAISAVEGEPVIVGRLEWFREGRFLYCELPSGRRLAYPDPEVRLRETPWGEKRPSMTFMGVDTHTHKWTRQTTYGGLLVENCTQAVARDLLAAALLRLELGGIYEPVLSIHDESVAEGPIGIDIEDFSEQMTISPDWAEECPIAVESWSGPRYRK